MDLRGGTKKRYKGGGGKTKEMSMKNIGVKVTNHEQNNLNRGGWNIFSQQNA